MGKQRSDSGVLSLPPKCKAKPLRVERGRQAESTECSVSEMSAMTAPGVLAEFFAWSVVSFAGSEEGLSERMNVVKLNGV